MSAAPALKTFTLTISEDELFALKQNARVCGEIVLAKPNGVAKERGIACVIMQLAVIARAEGG